MQIISPTKPQSAFQRHAHPEFDKRHSQMASTGRQFEDFLHEEPHAEHYSIPTLAMEDFLALVELPTIPVNPRRKQPEPDQKIGGILPYGLPARGDGSFFLKFDA